MRIRLSCKLVLALGGLHGADPCWAKGDPSVEKAAAAQGASAGSRSGSQLAKLGSMSLGKPAAGLLVNGVQMPKGEAWVFADRGNAWGTRQTIDALTRCISEVYRRFPDTPKVVIGHISARRGGKLAPHLSHQQGRDADVGFYYKSDKIVWYERATAENLDRARTWALIVQFIMNSDVEFILIDRSVQVLLREYATKVGENPAWLAAVFDGRGPYKRPLIRHIPGHTGHMHIRFRAAQARQRALGAQKLLMEAGIIRPKKYFVEHEAKRGDTLIGLAKRYKVTVKQIQEANEMKNTVLHRDRVYKIPQERHVEMVHDPVPPKATLPSRDAAADNKVLMAALEEVSESVTSELGELSRASASEPRATKPRKRSTRPRKPPTRKSPRWPGSRTN